MKTRILLTILGAAAFAAMTASVNASDALLSPRAAGNEIKHIAAVTGGANLLAASQGTLLAPRAFGNQINKVSGTTPVTVKCPAIGSPKYAVAAGNTARTSCCDLTLADCATMDNMPK